MPPITLKKVHIQPITQVVIPEEIRTTRSGKENIISARKVNVNISTAKAITVGHTNNGTITKPRITGGI